MATRKPDKPLGQIVEEVGQYPLDAFIFIQECIGLASDMVHGPMSRDENDVVKWMGRHSLSLDDLRQEWAEGKLPPNIAKSLDRIGEVEKMNRHVTGQQLCWAIRDVSLERWGLMARSVLKRFNVTTTEDIGTIVYALVDSGWLQKQPTDSVHDFENVYSFGDAFEPGYRINT